MVIKGDTRSLDNGSYVPVTACESVSCSKAMCSGCSVCTCVSQASSHVSAEQVRLPLPAAA